MSCDTYEKFELGEIGEQTFRQHLESCESCREQYNMDNRLLTLSQSLKEPVDASGLWERIEDTLLHEKANERKTFPTVFNRRFQFLLAASVLLAAVAIGVYFGVILERHGSGLLSGSALKKVQQTEQQYMAAITQLEAKAQPRMQKMDIELVLLYQDRLAVIDSQIEECKEALAQNPANSHIRRCLLAALQDKKETLTDILQTRTGSVENN